LGEGAKLKNSPEAKAHRINAAKDMAPCLRDYLFRATDSLFSLDEEGTAFIAWELFSLASVQSYKLSPC